MPGDEKSIAPPVRRILYKELTTADVRKLRAQSNDADTGGGARDLRLPYAEFDELMRHLFPNTRTEVRRRVGYKAEVTIQYGLVMYKPANAAEGVSATTEMCWEPPTTARPREGRIPRIHQSPALAAEPMNDRGRTLVLIIQDKDSALRAYYAYEDDLRSGLWNSAVSRPILHCMDNIERKRKSVQGYIDYTQGVHHCHGARAV